jgi:hypothetical protein
MRRLSLLVLVLAMWVLAGCQIEITPTPMPTPSPFPIRPTQTPAPVTFTPAPTSVTPAPTPATTATPPTGVQTVVSPGPGPGPGPGGQASVVPTPSSTPTPPSDLHVAPRAIVNVSPEQGTAGTTFTATGQNWLAGEGIFLEIRPEGSDTSGQVAIAVAGDGGRFVATFTLPTEWPSSRPVTLIARNYNNSREATTSILFIASTATPIITHWRGEYFNNPDLTGDPALTRDDQQIDFDWGTDQRPGTNIPHDYFSARWTRKVDFTAGAYRFAVTADDGVRLFIDNDTVIDEWQVNPGVTFTADRYLSAGPHLVRLEYYNAGGQAKIKLEWAFQNEFAGWRAEYYPNSNLAGPATVVRSDPELTFNWGGASPVEGIPGQNWSARWSRTVDLQGGRYRFYLSADDGVRLFIDGGQQINEWHQATGDTYFVDVDLSDGSHDIRVEYYQGDGDSYIDLWWTRIDQFADWMGEYFPNMTLSGRPALVRNDGAIDFDWGDGSPSSDIPPDGFSVRWTRQLDFQGGNYVFTILADDGVRFWIDDELIIDRWSDGSGTTDEKTVFLTEGSHRLRLEYYENGGLAQVHLNWEFQPLK